MANQITPNPSVPSQVVQEVKFPKFVNNLGIIPTSYKDSMSYYECLAWLCKYLEETVIPSVNQNGDAVEELQGLYIELNSYVTNYFDNLDVQEEINNKLDQMATTGQLQIIVNNLFEDLRTEVNNEIQVIDNKVNSATSGSPAGVYSTLSDLTSDNPDHTKIYLVTADGNWYYYNTSNSTWTSGGVYQSEGLSDNSINFLKLDDLLQANFNVEYSEDLNLGTEYVGYIKIVNNAVVIQEDTNYRNRRYNLEINKIYQFNGYNESASTGLVILDENNSIVYNSNPTTQSGQTYFNKIFSVSNSGYKAYIGYNNSYAARNPLSFATRLREINNVSNNLKISDNIPLLHTVEGTFSNNAVVGAKVSLATTGQPEESSFLLYPMENGKKYSIKGYDHYQAKGFIILDNNYNVLVTNENSAQQVTLRELEYTATQNGFIGLSTYAGEPSLEIIQDSIEIKPTNNLKNKKIYCCGDSITLGAGNNNVSYINIISNKNEMSLTKDGIGGSSLAERSGRTDAIVTRIENLSSSGNYDYIVIQGGINDSFTNVPLGNLTDSYDGNYDNSTIIGAVEKICYELITKFPTAKKLFVLSHRLISIVTGEEALSNQITNWNGIISALKKWGVDYIDLTNVPFASYNNDYYTNYFSDNENIGLHPNNQGYNIGYVDQISNKLNLL